MSTSARLVTTINRYLEEIQLGDRFASGRARTVTEADFVTYSCMAGDWVSLHTDADWCEREGPFPGRVAAGCLTLSVAAGLEFSMSGGNPDKILALYGMDRVRFVKPVFIGDTIHLEGEVTGLEDRDDRRGVLVVHEEISNQRNEVVAVLDKRLLIKKRAYDA